MLSEALNQLQDMMKNSKSGSKGKKKQSMKQLQQMQQQLNNNMQKARDQMQKNGNKGTVPKGTMSEEFAKMAQQQCWKNLKPMKKMKQNGCKNYHQI
ncbi:hypothetical protein D3C85_1494010 [compost metagenome]